MGSAWELVRRRLIICGSDEPAFFRRARPLPEQQHVAAKMQPTSSKTPPTAAMAITAHNGSGGSGGGELGGGGEPATIATASLRGSAACAQRGEEKGATGKAAPRREQTNHATHLPRQYGVLPGRMWLPTGEAAPSSQRRDFAWRRRRCGPRSRKVIVRPRFSSAGRWTASLWSGLGSKQSSSFDVLNCHRVTAVELHPPLAPATMAVQVGGIEERGGELLAPSPDY